MMTDENKIIEDLKRCLSDFREFTEKLEIINISVVIGNHLQDLANVPTGLKDELYDSKEDIKKMYKIINDNEPESKKTVKVTDVNYLIHSYHDYYEGLVSYLKEIREKSNDGKDNFNENIIEKIAIAKNKDEHFCDMCIEEKEELFKDAMKNIESALDYFEIVEEIKKDFNDLISARYSENNVRTASIIFFISSTVSFLYRVRGCISDSFYSLCSVMKNGNDKDVVSSEEERFKIF